MMRRCRLVCLTASLLVAVPDSATPVHVASITSIGQSGLMPGTIQAVDDRDRAARRKKFFEKLDQLLKRIPKYELPRLNENGDIIIKRLNPPKNKREEKKEFGDGGRKSPGQRDL